MRASLFALTFLAAVATSAALAQPAAPPAAPLPMRLFTSAADAQALIAKAKADRKDNQPMVAEPILALAPYHAQLEYRPGVQPAAVHERDAEFMYVVEGSGTIVTGGTLVNEKRTNPHNLSGTSIAGGTTRAIAKGDFIVVPQNTPHQVLPSADGPIVIETLHVPRPAPADWP